MSTVSATNAQPEGGAPERVQPGALAPELELVLARFRLRAQRRAAWLYGLWQQPADDPAPELADDDAPAAEAAWIAADPDARLLSERIEAAEAELAGHGRSRLAQLCLIFGLSAEEVDLLHACLAVALDPSLERLCAYLQGRARPFVTEELAARLFDHGRCGIWEPESALYRWEIVRPREVAPTEPLALALDPAVRDWLCGRDVLDETLVGIARIHPPQPPLAAWPVETLATALAPKLGAATAARIRVRVVGPDRSGRHTFAAAVSARLGLPLLAVDADAIDDAQWRRVFRRVQRHAFLQRCVPAWSGESLARRPWPTDVLAFPLQFAIGEPGHELAAARDVIEHKVEMPALREVDRAAAWQQFMPARFSPEDAGLLARRYRVGIGEIAEACAAAPPDVDEAGRRLREAGRAKLGNLAQLLRCPFAWDDLVLAPALLETLRDLLYEAEHRGEFWEREEAQRLFPQGRGLIALLSGPPGTGKTMAAQVIAGSLGYDLFRIDLAAVISKYVGETSQNLDKILTRAAHMDAVLLFDEADALFAKRASEVRDAQDKFANSDAAYLLQAIESYAGIALLATNQKTSIDPAFLRRLRYVLEFSRPDAAQRLELWRRILAELGGAGRAEALADELALLAETVETTGAQIKNAVLAAIFVARRAGGALGLPHLVRGLERELAKEGRALGTKTRERMRQHAP